MKAEKIAKKAKAGQFIILRTSENGERIPLTIADTHPDKGTVTIIFQIVGAQTMKLNELEVGDFIHDFVGPLGKPSQLEGIKKVCIVGGGVGCAIAYPTAKACFQQGSEVTLISGFRNKDLMILEEEFKQVSHHFFMLSDDGSVGEKGLVTEKLYECLTKESYDEVIAIGPLKMMQAVCECTKRFNIKTTVSMNPIMIDGTGMCGGCRLSVGGKTRFACVDGPDFDGHEVDFEEVMNRNAQYREFEHHACNLLKEGAHHA